MHVADARLVAEGAGVAGAGLVVVSVAAAADVDRADVLAAAYEVSRTAYDAGLSERRHSLFDLPLGETPLWSLREEWRVLGGEEHSALLPCWSASSKHDLTHRELGVPAAAQTLWALLGSPDLGFESRQAAVARFSRYGFEAAAVTGLFLPTSAPPAGIARSAELRFAHPYAVVAVATQKHAVGRFESEPGPWHGIPVFSAWVSDPEDVPAADADDA